MVTEVQTLTLLTENGNDKFIPVVATESYLSQFREINKLTPPQIEALVQKEIYRGDRIFNEFMFKITDPVEKIILCTEPPKESDVVLKLFPQEKAKEKAKCYYCRCTKISCVCVETQCQE